MAEKETAFAILQVVALVLPAVAIYLQIISARSDLSNMDDGEAANYHAIRLTFVYLLITSIMLIGAILIFPAWINAGEVLTDTALVLLAFSLLTFSLPVIFSRAGLADSRSILWPYRNTLHRIQDSISSSND